MKKKIRIGFEVLADLYEDEKNYRIVLPRDVSKFLDKQGFKRCLVMINDKGGKGDGNDL